MAPQHVKGVTCVSSPYGRVSGATRDQSGKLRFQRQRLPLGLLASGLLLDRLQLLTAPRANRITAVKVVVVGIVLALSLNEVSFAGGILQHHGTVGSVGLIELIFQSSGRIQDVFMALTQVGFLSSQDGDLVLSFEQFLLDLLLV